MPWTIENVERFNQQLSPRQKRIWLRVANSQLRSCLARGGSEEECEARAIQSANAVAGRAAPVANAADDVFTTIAVHVGGNAGEVRYELLDERDHLVVPVVPIIEGVLNELLVPAEEIAMFVASWDNRPVPISHPINEYGDHISANAPSVVEQSIGRFFGACMDGKRLVGELWIDIDKAQRAGGDAAECLRRLEVGEMIEVSTAFYSEIEPSPGVFRGQHYSGIHRHLRPDHLALLPHAVGACSLHDG